MIRSFGRTELAQLYFPGLTPDGAWHKLRAWLHLNPRLSHFYELRRRTFTPAEVQLIYTELGELTIRGTVPVCTQTVAHRNYFLKSF